MLKAVLDLAWMFVFFILDSYNKSILLLLVTILVQKHFFCTEQEEKDKHLKCECPFLQIQVEPIFLASDLRKRHVNNKAWVCFIFFLQVHRLFVSQLPSKVSQVHLKFKSFQISLKILWSSRTFWILERSSFSFKICISDICLHLLQPQTSVIHCFHCTFLC